MSIVLRHRVHQICMQEGMTSSKPTCQILPNTVQKSYNDERIFRNECVEV